MADTENNETEEAAGPQQDPVEDPAATESEQQGGAGIEEEEEEDIAGEEEDEEEDSDEDEEIAERRKQALKEQYPRGCEHYRRRCKLRAECCQEVFWCRHCHNDVKNVGDPKKAHEMDRHKVEVIVCAICEKEQGVSNECVGCGTKFGEYFCERCRFYDDDLSKGIFHCEGCGICRVGGRENFFHCQTCGCCFALSLQNRHRCVEGSLDQNCPVCQENLFHSTQQAQVLSCGHVIHNHCFRSLFRYRYSCPICNCSLADMSEHFRRLDDEVAVTEMPAEYSQTYVTILCHDCHNTSRVLFHVLGLKCNPCGSYNTRRV